MPFCPTHPLTAMDQPTPQTIHLKDYLPPAFWVDTVDLTFVLDPQATLVHTATRYRRNFARGQGQALALDGEGLELLKIALDGKPLPPAQYSQDTHGLRVFNPPDTFTLNTTTRVDPSNNLSFMGLYVSNGNFFTQCEAEGFRKITFFQDRPDVVAKYSVTIIGDKASYPVMLSNGNCVETKELGNNKRSVKWVDPFAKPSYLFALVAGKLAMVERKIKTGRGKPKTLQIYVEPRDIDQTAHAMESLVQSIAWDEKRYGLPLDLDQYMVVAVGDFNMGAMENKGLNIFNTKYVLAKPETATDIDFDGIESVIAHEYFHNWTGNRVTCREWFQLSLKEGLTVFRDQEFSRDMTGSATGAAVRRIGDVRTLRTAQFPEDAGPMAHPVRPDSYQEISNFYTLTIYEKGAEVVRMIQSLLGLEGFRRGMDLYFKRHDGQAVTCDDFAAAMFDASPGCVEASVQTQFRRWYAQAGTPQVLVTDAWDSASGTYTLYVEQQTPATPGQRDKRAFVIPFKLALLDAKGKPQSLTLAGEASRGAAERTLQVTGSRNVFPFVGLKSKPTPSLLRDFSAPVIVEFDYSDDDLAFLMRHDNDAFNRWEAGQRLMLRLLIEATHALAQDRDMRDMRSFTQAYLAILRDTKLDPAFKAEALALPSESVVAEAMMAQSPDGIDPLLIHRAREGVIKSLALGLRPQWEGVYRENQTPGAYSPKPLPAGKRALANLALAYLARIGDREAVFTAQARYESARNMTERMGGLNALMLTDAPAKRNALNDFYTRYNQEALVMDKWLTLQATAHREDTLQEVIDLMAHPAYQGRNPNKIRALVGAFCNSNPAVFHAADGSGYTFWADNVIAIDAFNPQVAARLARALARWRQYEPGRRALMRSALARVAVQPKLSKDTTEVVSKSLAG
jgi:aminopeptidase N